MKTISIIVFTLVVAGIIGLYMVGWSESHSNNLSSYDEAVKSELIGKGWIPSFIPKSSYNIKEHHRVDQPYIYVELNFDPSEITTFKKACSLMEPNKYRCDNSGYPVYVMINGGNHAVITSINNGT